MRTSIKSKSNSAIKTKEKDPDMISERIAELTSNEVHPILDRVTALERTQQGIVSSMLLYTSCISSHIG